MASCLCHYSWRLLVIVILPARVRIRADEDFGCVVSEGVRAPPHPPGVEARLWLRCWTTMDDVVAKRAAGTGDSTCSCLGRNGPTGRIVHRRPAVYCGRS